MRSTCMLVIAGLRKYRTQILSQVIIVFFTALLLNIGLLTVIKFGSYFDEKSDELNAAHISFAFFDSVYDDKFMRFLQSNESVISTQKDAVLLMQGDIKMPSTVVTTTIVVFDYDNMGGMSNIKMVGDYLPTGGSSIYVPYVFKFNGDLRLGGQFTIMLNEERYSSSNVSEYDFQVAGFTEDIMLGVTNVGAIGVYLPHEAYTKLEEQLPEFYNGTFISAQFEDKEMSIGIMDEFSDEFTGEDSYAWGSAIMSAKYSRTVTSNIVAIIIIAFSIITMIVSLIIIRFRIGNAIDEEMRDYGALKAIGYINVQIIASLVMQFLLISVIAAFAGIMFSYLAINLIAQMLAAQTGLNWVQGFDMAISLASLFAIIITTVFTALSSAVRIRKIPPIIALRGHARSVPQRNMLPLDIVRMTLGFALAIKTTFNNARQNILILAILMSVSFAVVFGIVLSYNAPRDTFVKMLSGQYVDINTNVSPKEDVFELLADIQKQENVTNAFLTDNQTLIYDNQYLIVTIFTDFAEMTNNQTYAGRNPEHPNEVVIGGMLGYEKGVHIGDTIILSFGEREEEYIITGFFQSVNNMGRESLLTADGYRLINPDYKESVIYVEIEKDADCAQVIGAFEQRYGEKLIDIQNDREFMYMQLSSILSMINILAVAICIITGMMIFFTLFLVVRTMVLRRKRELGIQKAIGFTTFQLMNQVAGSFVPVAVIGAGIGTIIGSLTMNDCVGILFRSIGIMKVDFIIPYSEIAVVAVLICLLTYIVSILVSARIRKISAYTLITE